jgi:hypothetical protein
VLTADRKTLRGLVESTVPAERTGMTGKCSKVFVAEGPVPCVRFFPIPGGAWMSEVMTAPDRGALTD